MFDDPSLNARIVRLHDTLDSAAIAELAELAWASSPENLACDGELSSQEIAARARQIIAAMQRLLERCGLPNLEFELDEIGALHLGLDTYARLSAHEKLAWRSHV